MSCTIKTGLFKITEENSANKEKNARGHINNRI